MTRARTMVDRDPQWSTDVTTVLERVRPQLVKTLNAYHVPLRDSEDVLQDALLSLVTRWEHIREPGLWLIGAVRHLCRSYVRRQCRSKLVVEVDQEQLEWLAGATPSGEEQHGARHDLERLVRELTPQQRRVLRLSFALGLDAGELSRSLGGANPASVRRARARAIARLRGLMAAER